MRNKEHYVEEKARLEKEIDVLERQNKSRDLLTSQANARILLYRQYIEVCNKEIDSD